MFDFVVYYSIYGGKFPLFFTNLSGALTNGAECGMIDWEFSSVKEEAFCFAVFLHTPRRSHLQPRFADAARTPAGGGAGTPSGPLRTGQDFRFAAQARAGDRGSGLRTAEKGHDGPRLDERGTGVGRIYLRRSGGRVSDVVFPEPFAAKSACVGGNARAGRRLVHTSDFRRDESGRGVARVRRETDALLASLGYVHDRSRCLYVAERPNSERVALFAHQGFGMAFLSSLLDIPYPMFCSHFDLDHSGMTVIEFSETPGETVPCVLQLSNDAHLYGDGLP